MEITFNSIQDQRNYVWKCSSIVAKLFQFYPRSTIFLKVYNSYGGRILSILSKINLERMDLSLLSTNLSILSKINRDRYRFRLAWVWSLSILSKINSIYIFNLEEGRRSLSILSKINEGAAQTEYSVLNQFFQFYPRSTRNGSADERAGVELSILSKINFGERQDHEWSSFCFQFYPRSTS